MISLLRRHHSRILTDIVPRMPEMFSGILKKVTALYNAVPNFASLLEHASFALKQLKNVVS